MFKNYIMNMIEFQHIFDFESSYAVVNFGINLEKKLVSIEEMDVDFYLSSLEGFDAVVEMNNLMFYIYDKLVKKAFPDFKICYDKKYLLGIANADNGTPPGAPQALEIQDDPDN